MSKDNTSVSNRQVELELFPLSQVQGKKVSASFSSPDLSSCGGLMLVREAEKECDIISRIASCIKDERCQHLVEHSYEEMVRYVVTNISNSYGPGVIYNISYCGRGAMELMIKELKLYCDANRMSCTSFRANQFRLFLYSAAYVLLHSMQHTTFAGTEVENMSIMSVRERFILSAVFITEKKTCIRLEFASKHTMRPELEAAFRYRQPS